jgi:ribosomal-protein-alanine acetyltransferase
VSFLSLSKTVFRRAHSRDLEALIALEETCFTSDQLSPRQTRYWITHPGGVFLVALADSHLVGSILAITRKNSNLARLYSLAILPEYRGRGIASELLKNLEACVTSMGKQGIRLEVRPDNVAAKHLYRSMGYQECGSRTDYYQDHCDALQMKKLFAVSAAIGLPRKLIPINKTCQGK